GTVNIHPDPDGRVRYAQLRIEGPDGATYYSLPLVAATNKVRADLSSAQRTGDIFTVPAPLGDRVIPIDRRGGMSIYYAAPPAPAQTLVVPLAGPPPVFRLRLYGFLGAPAPLVLYVVGGYGLFALQTQGPIGAGPVEVPSIAYLIPAVFWWIILLGYPLVEEQITVARTRITFGRFVTPSVARTIIDREEAGKLALGGEEKRVTVL